MARRWKNGTYLKVRRWVDRDIADYPRNSIALQGVLIAMLALAMGAYAAGSLAIAAFWLLAFPPGAIWTAFVLWRVVRITRAATIRGDRGYDQKTRYILPPEYADSESVWAASRRKRLNARNRHASPR